MNDNFYKKYEKSKRFAMSFYKPQTTFENLLSDLTPTENKILKLIYKGYTQEEMANILTCAKTTIATHVQNISKKLECSGQIGIMAKRIEQLEEILQKQDNS